MKTLSRKIFVYLPLVILMIISIFNMYSSRYISEIYHNHMMKQCIWFGLGFLFLFLSRYFSFSKLLSCSPYFYYGCNILLLLVLFLGKSINGARAWFHLGFFSLQPSELMKLALSLYLIYVVSLHKGKDITLILKIILITLIPSLLVFLEPDTGAIIFYVFTAFAVLLSSKVSKKWFAFLISLLFIFATIFFFLYFREKDLFIRIFGTSFFYRMDRIVDFKNQSGMQLEHALISIGSAGLFGHGLTNHPIYFPEAPTDFIVALTISNFGIIGGILILISYLFLDIYFIYLCLKEQWECQMFIATFLIIFLFSQMQNILMNVGLLPIMGIPLPFLSYGGTSLLIHFIFLGIILSFIDQKEKYPFRIF